MRVRGYLSAIPAAARKNRKDRLFQAYTADALKAIAENTSRYFIPGVGAVQWGTTMKNSLSTEFGFKAPEPPEKAKDDPRSCAEITAGIWQRMRGEKE